MDTSRRQPRHPPVPAPLPYPEGVDDPTGEGEATRLLRRLADGDAGAAATLMPILYEELRASAAACMRRERGDHTLQPTALVHEAWVRIAGSEQAPAWNDREHFLRIAARAMRRVLVDHSRGKRARELKESGERVPLDAVLDACEERAPDLEQLDEALGRLEQVDESLAQLVELRFFAGLTLAEAAGALGVSTPTAERRWRTARLWLHREVGGSDLE